MFGRSRTIPNENNAMTSIFSKSKLYEIPISDSTWPIVYHAEYNIAFCGIEKLHPFDSGKWGKVHQYLIDDDLIQKGSTVEAKEATESDLLVVHTQSYLNSLKWSASVAMITEVPPVAFLPNFIVQRRVLRPLRLQVGGSVMCGKLAMRRGWAVNVGGGFHHCCAVQGGGFCAYADITLLIRFVFEHFPEVERAMIIDLDAHQGNGHARDFMKEDKVYILDVYNRGIYPQDGFAKNGIKRKVEVRSGIGDEQYLRLVERNVREALDEFRPQFVVYNAGTDILDGDPLGCMCVTAEGIRRRDEIVFEACRGRAVPIAMLTSGGYQRSNARIIADSILSLHRAGLIALKSDAARDVARDVTASSNTM